jgi:branched-chain amino acid transport system substrate-binding protein
LAQNVELSAKEQGFEIKGNDGIDKNSANYRSVAAKIADTGADCFVFTGITANNAVQVFKDMAAALPDGMLFGPEGIAETGFFDTSEGGIPADVAQRTLLTIPGLPPEEYTPAGQEFVKAYEAEYGEKNPDRYAIYGYESMKLILDSIAAAGDNGDDRATVVDQVFATKDRDSVLGTYSIDPSGDTTLTTYGIYRIQDNETAFDHTVEPPTR